MHFNFSLPRPFWAAFRDTEGRGGERLGAFASERYFALVRNFHRRGWLVPLLFGSSPAICRSFLGTAPHAFSEFGRGTLYEPFATSLRMSDIGYKNKSQRQLGISYDSPADYIRTLHGATEAPHPPYEEIGVVVDGEHRQLNANLLQIENEYYSFVRPKQIARSGEKPTVALQRRGVRYVEIRALDVDPFSPVGLEEDTMRFMEAFLIHCVLDSSPPLSRREREESEENQRLVAVRGRDPALRLRRAGASIPVFEWAREIVDAVAAIAEMLDAPTRNAPLRRGDPVLPRVSRRSATASVGKGPGRDARALGGILRVRHAQVGGTPCDTARGNAAGGPEGSAPGGSDRLAARPARNRGRGPPLVSGVPGALLRPAPHPNGVFRA